MAQTQSLFGACCLRTLLHLRHYLDSVHSDLLSTQYVVRAMSRPCSPTCFVQGYGDSVLRGLVRSVGELVGVNEGRKVVSYVLGNQLLQAYHDYRCEAMGL